MGLIIVPKINVKNNRGRRYIRQVTTESWPEESDENAGVFALFTSLWANLLGDSPLEKQPGVGTFGILTLNRFVNSLCDDYREIARAYKTAASSLERHLGTDQDDYGKIPQELFNFLKKTPIVKELLQFCHTKDPELLRFILTFLNFGKKTPYSSEVLRSTAFHGWCETELRLENLDPPIRFLNGVRNVMKLIVADWEPLVTLWPRHGPGAVHDIEGVSPANKSHKMQLSNAAMYWLEKNPALLRGLPYNLQRQVTWWKEDKKNNGRTARYLSKKTGKKVSGSASGLLFVPKNISTSRTISAQMASHLYLQLGVHSWMRDNMARGILTNHIDFFCQTWNKWDAKVGSMYLPGRPKAATLDLSQASDSVAGDSVVKYVTPWSLLEPLYATRASRVEISRNGKLYSRRLSKFAPMGSGVCFEYQTLLYWCIVFFASVLWYRGSVEACKKSFREEWPLEDLITKYGNLPSLCRQVFDYTRGEHLEKLLPHSVYGDDITCDTRIVPIVVHILRAFGFMLNEEKSFSNGLFRESCGVRCFYGADCTPLIFSFKDYKGEDQITGKVLASLCDGVNSAVKFGYTHLAKALRKMVFSCHIRGIRKSGKNPILTVSDDVDDLPPLAVYTASGQPENQHLQRRKPVTGKTSSSWKFLPLPFDGKMKYDDPYQFDTMLVPAVFRHTLAKERSWVIGDNHTNIHYQRTEVAALVMLPTDPEGDFSEKWYDGYGIEHTVSPEMENQYIQYWANVSKRRRGEELYKSTRPGKIQEETPFMMTTWKGGYHLEVQWVPENRWGVRT